MGNNTSSTRKSSAPIRQAGSVRKSYQSQSNHHNLEEEFSDLILHEVKRQKHENLQPDNVSGDSSALAQQLSRETDPSKNDRFTNDLIEDEFNELNQGMLENEELSRNILPVTTGSDEDDTMQVDEECTAAGSISPLATNDIAKVDFTKLSQPAAARMPGYNSASVSASEQSSVSGYPAASRAKDTSKELVPVRIKWINHTREVITKVAIIGSFSNWRDVIKLKRSSTNPNEYHTTVKLPLGVHKLLYVVNNEYRVSESLPTATDQEGIFFNWFEVLDPQHLFNSPMDHSMSSCENVNILQTAGEHNASQIQKKSNSYLIKMSKQEKEGQSEHLEYSELPSDNTYIQAQDSTHTPSHDPSYSSLLEGVDSSSTALTYSSEIPEMLVDYNYFKNKSPDYELPEPPQLPAHLNNVLLNKISSQPPQPNSLTIPHAGNDHGHSKRPALRRADSSYYASNVEAYHRSIPNHVILNHLMTTSIRNDVLTVACITRYSGKFVTQIMHSPADTVMEK